jgi:hypothetical protein
MSNFSILRPVNQQLIQYPYWIAQDNQFSFEEKGLLTNLLSFKDSFHKSALARFASNGKRSLDRAWKGLIAKGILIAQRFKANNHFDWSYTVNLEQLEKIARIPTVNYAEIALRHGVSEAVARAILERMGLPRRPAPRCCFLHQNPVRSLVTHQFFEGILYLVYIIPHRPHLMAHFVQQVACLVWLGRRFF